MLDKIGFPARLKAWAELLPSATIHEDVRLLAPSTTHDQLQKFAAWVEGLLKQASARGFRAYHVHHATDHRQQFRHGVCGGVAFVVVVARGVGAVVVGVAVAVAFGWLVGWLVA
eukprot:13777433-Alexandrium_andersonii.AAC.1